MAGRNADDAVRAYKQELEEAFKCLKCYCKIEFSPGRRGIGGDVAWLLVGEGNSQGIKLPGIGGLFQASQTLSIVECDPAKFGGQVRLQTKNYDYSFDDERGQEIWAFHWHPNSTTSPVSYPHVHLRAQFEKAHLATGRLAIEHAIHWAIECGATPRSADWKQKLDQTLMRYHHERSWS